MSSNPAGGFRATYPTDVRNGAGFKVEKDGLSLRISADYSTVPKADVAPDNGELLVQDADTGEMLRLDVSSLINGGVASGRFEVWIANEPIDREYNVVDLGNGRCAIASPLDESHRGKLIGLTTTAALKDQPITVMTFGSISEISPDLPEGADLFVSDGSNGVPLGAIATEPADPANGAFWDQHIGRVTSPSSISYNPGLAADLPVGALPSITAGVYAYPGFGPGQWAPGDQVAPKTVAPPAATPQIAAPFLLSQYPDGRFIDMFDDRIGGAQKDKPVSTRDDVKLFQKAVESGDPVNVPPRAGGYCFRGGLVSLAAPTPVDLTFAQGARIKAGKELATVTGGQANTVAGNLFTLSTTALTDAAAAYGPAQGNRISHRIVGLVADTYEIDDLFAAAGLKRWRGAADTGPGLGLLDISRAYCPEIIGLKGFSKRTAPTPENGDYIGFGSWDTIFGSRACFRERVVGLTGEGPFDCVGYITGDNETYTLTSPFQSTLGSVTVIVTDTTARGLDYVDGDYIWIEQATDANGLTFAWADPLLPEPLPIKRIDANRYSVDLKLAPGNSSSGATASGTFGGPVVIRPSTAVRPTKMNGEGGLFADVTALYCNNGLQFKRSYTSPQVRNFYGAFLRNGVACANTDRRANHGGGLNIDGLKCHFIAGIPVGFYRDDCAIDNFEITNFGKTLDGSAFIGSSSETAAIIAYATPGLRIGKGKIRQRGAWQAKTGDGGSTFGIVVRGWPMYPTPTRAQVIEGVEIDGTHRDVFVAANIPNVSVSNPDPINVLLPSLYSGVASKVTSARTITPTLSFDGGGTVTADVVAEARLEESRLVARMDFAVTAIGGTPSGNLRVIGLPVCRSPGRVPIIVLRQNIEATGALVGYAQFGSGTINLSVDNNGALTGVPAANVSVGDRLSLTVSYLIDP